MTCHRLRKKLQLPVALSLLLSIGLVQADEWGDWDDLPDNLLESQNDTQSLEELSGRLDQLIADHAETTGTSQERLLERWLNQLAPKDRKNLSLDTLLSLPEDWTDEQFEAWYESLGNGPGNGQGNGWGYGSGNGWGNGPGNGSGNGLGNGQGNGSGNGPGNGPSNGPGNGPGNSPGNGQGNGPGNGSGAGHNKEEED